MERSEEFYRTLCSLETLRSGKKGFFRDLSECVMDIAGEQWIAKVFGRLTNDEDRIRTLFTDGKTKVAMMEALRRVKLLYRDKDAAASRAKRLEGFEAATAGERERALLLFSQAVLRAPAPGKCEAVDRGFSLALALLGRAGVFIASNEHSLALEDLNLPAELDLPDQLRTELDSKKEECERFLRANEMSIVPVKSSIERSKGSPYSESKPLPALLSGGENPSLPGASALLEIQETAAAGKQAIAKQEIEAGDILVVEPPLAACLLPEYFGTHCQHCFSRFRGPIGCPDCSSVAFCGRTCRDAAMASYHKYECKILALLIGSGMSVLSMLALRMVTQIGWRKCSKVCQALSERQKNAAAETNGSATKLSTDLTDTTTEPLPQPKLSKSAKRRTRKKLLELKYRDKSDSSTPDKEEVKIKSENSDDSIDMRAYDLVTHEKRRTAKDFFERSLMAAFLLKCLQRVDFFENPSTDDETPNEQEIAVGGLLLRHLQLLQFNAHEFFETRLGTDHRFRGTKTVYLGVAIYPTVARFNHDCYPAVTRYFVGRCIVIRAIRSLRIGDVVAENYGPIFTKRKLEERRRSLAGRYWFRCECTACREDWPHFETLSNEAVRLRCPTEGCGTHHRRPRDPDTIRPIECSNCHRKVNLRGPTNGLRKCEQLYADGFAAMDEEQPIKALEAFVEAAKTFHKVAVPPHKDTHLAEIAASACMADAGNTWKPQSPV